MKKLIPLFLLIVVLFCAGCGSKSLVATSDIPPIVHGLIISPEAVAVRVGETQQFFITGFGMAGSSTALISWEVEGGIGSIDASGIFTALISGEGKINAISGALLGTAEVSVSEGKTITGKITDGISDKIISGAIVYSSGKLATSDASGNYILSGLPITTESITVLTSGYPAMTVKSASPNINVELYLLPRYVTIGKTNATLSFICSDESGSPINDFEAELMKNGTTQYFDYSNANLYDAYVDSNGADNMYFLYILSSNRAGLKRIELRANEENNLGIIQLEQHSIQITGEIFSLSNNWDGTVWGGAMFNGQRNGVEFLWSPLQHNNKYVLAFNDYEIPPTSDGIKYYLKASVYPADACYINTLDSVEKMFENIEIASGESKVYNFELSGLISSETPVNAISGIGLAPTFSWSAPNPKFNLFTVVLFEPGSGNLIKWYGTTSSNSITYPDFSATKLVPGREYNWSVYGYYIPGYAASATTPCKILNVVDNSFAKQSIRNRGEGLHVMAAPQISEYLEKTMSLRQSFTP